MGGPFFCHSSGTKTKKFKQRRHKYDYIRRFTNDMKQVAIIGGGISSLSAACYLASQGFQVDVYEKNSTVGGRARQYKEAGFTFDIGPTWYWMPDIFENFFGDFNKKPSDYYQLDKLDPAYKVFFSEQDSISIPGSPEEIIQVFESREKGAGRKLEKLLRSAAYNYEIAMKEFVFKPGRSPLELVSFKTLPKAGLFLSSISQLSARSFKDPQLRQIINFPVLFLGAKPSDTPAFYSFMNHADFTMGTWYAKGGMYSFIEGLESLAKELGVRIHTEAPVEEISVKGKRVTGIKTAGEWMTADLVVSGADYHHTETLLEPSFRTYSEKYWEKRTFAPSALMFFLGVDKKIQNVDHHTLFFDESFDKHAVSIYDKPEWPEAPLFYGSISSITDPTVAPEGKEAVTFLIPLAPGLEDSEEIRQHYFQKIMDRFEKLTKENIRDHISVHKSYSVKDFTEDYNSYKGNAYGLANILKQTAFLRPKMKSKKVEGLYFTGQLTVPGPGVPPSLISGNIVSQMILKDQAKKS